MNWAIRFIFIMGLSPIFFAHSQQGGDLGSDWIPPEDEEQYQVISSICGNGQAAGTDTTQTGAGYAWWTLAGCATPIVGSNKTTYREDPQFTLIAELQLQLSYTNRVVFDNGNESVGTITTTMTVYEIVAPRCTNPEYQIPVDHDGLDGIDRCYKTQCPASEFFWSDGSGNSTTPSGKICIQHPSSTPGQPGQMCEYEAIENDDGSRSDYTYQPSGSGCDCSSEAIPCYDAEDGEVTDYPQGQNGCVQLADTIMCDANEDERCHNGVCDPGCGKIGERFVCVESDVPDDQAQACQENDPRPSCNGKNPGDCPEGSLECLDPPEDEGEPQEPCVENDPRPECNGVDPGDTPGGDTGGEGDGKNPYAGIETRLDQANRNLKDIKDINKEIRDELQTKIDEEQINPSDVPEWQEAITKVEQFTSAGDVNADQTQFESDFAAQEGFFNNQIAGLVPGTGSCSPIAIELPYVSGSIDACGTLVQIRLVLEWIIVLLFVVYIRSAFNSLRPNGA